MEILRLKNDWHVDVFSGWKTFRIEPTFDVLSFYLHPQYLCMTVLNFSLVIDKHPKR